MSAPTPDEVAALLQVEHLLDARWPETKIEPSLARITALLDLLGNPQLSYPAIHVTGTNGKTSVTRMVDALLTAIQVLLHNGIAPTQYKLKYEAPRTIRPKDFNSAQIFIDGVPRALKGVVKNLGLLLDQ